MKMTFAIFGCLLCLHSIGHAEPQRLSEVQAVTQIEGGVELKTNSGILRVTAVARDTVRVQAMNGAPFSTVPSWAVVNPSQHVSVRVSQDAQSVRLDLPAGEVRINRVPLRLTFADASGNIIDQDAAPIRFDGQAFRVTKSMPDDEMYFGLGDKTSLELNNRAFTLWNTDAFGWQESTDPLYKSIPFFYGMRAGKAYGIFMDDTWRSSFDFGKARRDEYSFGAEGGELDYYFFFGPTPKQVLAAYTALTGTAPLPPLWALGYQQSRYSYYPQSRVEEIARTFRQKKIPADVIYLDIDYQDRNRPFTINRQLFPQFEQMIKDLKGEGFSVIAITDLHIAKADYPPYNSGEQQDVFVKNANGSEYVGQVWPGASVFPDFTLTRARDWWGGLYAGFVNIGIRGFWNDMNEPAVFTYPTKTMPLDVRHRLDDGTTILHLAAHNIVGMENSRATYGGLLKLEGNERPFVLTRATYAGGQRFAATWTGDNSSTYNHLRMSVPTLLNLGITGMPFVGDDIGGFNGSPTADLMTQWMWLGAFNPIFRDHTAKETNDQEPWAFGAQHEAFMRQAIEQRYRMLPYIYTLAEESSRTGVPMMRPMFMEFPDQQWLNGNQDEFMFGPAMLVAPRAFEFAQPYEVQLPTGAWFDYWTGALLQGGQHDGGPAMSSEIEKRKVIVNPNVDQLPVYVKAGSIIAQQPVVQSTAYVPNGDLELRVFPGTQCAGSLYMDDGHTFDYRKGEYLRLAMSCDANTQMAKLTIAPQQGSYKPWFHDINVVFYGAPHAAISATLDGQAMPVGQYDPQHHAVTVTVPYESKGQIITAQY